MLESLLHQSLRELPDAAGEADQTVATGLRRFPFLGMATISADLQGLGTAPSLQLRFINASISSSALGLSWWIMSFVIAGRVGDTRSVIASRVGYKG